MPTKRVTACPACSAAESRPLRHIVTHDVPASNRLVYCHCPRCGLVYVQDIIDTPDELHHVHTEPYERIRREEFLHDTAYRLKRNQYRKRWLEEQLTALGKTFGSKRALEIGAKDGSFLWLLQQDGWEVTGIDPNRRYGELGGQHYGVDIKNGYFQGGHFRDGSFNLVAAFHLIEHIHDPQTFLRTILAVLPADGILYLETPNLAYLHQRQLFRDHAILYSRRTLAQVLQQHGFNILAVTETAPGGLMSFDQLAVLAEASQPHAPRAWQQGDDFETAKAMIERALRDNFPYPAPTLKNHLFQLARRVMGASVAADLKRFYQAAQARRGRRQPAAVDPGDRSTMPPDFPEPIREAFARGVLADAHLRQIARLPDERAQLKVLARIKGYRLSVEQTCRLVDRELEASPDTHEERALT